MVGIDVNDYMPSLAEKKGTEINQSQNERKIA